MDENLSWEERPNVKKGRIGEEIVKNFLEQHGYEVLQPPNKALSGASVVDFSIKDEEGVTTLIEVKVKPTVYLQGLSMGVYTLPADQFQRYIDYSLVKNSPLKIYFVDVVRECIVMQDIMSLNCPRTIQGKEFPFISDTGIGICSCFHFEQFLFMEHLTPSEVDQLNSILVPSDKESLSAKGSLQGEEIIPEVAEPQRPTGSNINSIWLYSTGISSMSPNGTRLEFYEEGFTDSPLYISTRRVIAAFGSASSLYCQKKIPEDKKLDLFSEVVFKEQFAVYDAFEINGCSTGTTTHFFLVSDVPQILNSFIQKMQSNENIRIARRYLDNAVALLQWWNDTLLSELENRNAKEIEAPKIITGKEEIPTRETIEPEPVTPATPLPDDVPDKISETPTDTPYTPQFQPIHILSSFSGKDFITPNGAKMKITYTQGNFYVATRYIYHACGYAESAHFSHTAKLSDLDAAVVAGRFVIYKDTENQARNAYCFNVNDVPAILDLFLSRPMGKAGNRQDKIRRRELAGELRDWWKAHLLPTLEKYANTLIPAEVVEKPVERQPSSNSAEITKKPTERQPSSGDTNTFASIRKQAHALHEAGLSKDLATKTAIRLIANEHGADFTSLLEMFDWAMA